MFFVVVVALALFLCSCWCFDGPQAAKATIMKRVDGYMKRAETLKTIVDDQAAAKNGMGGPGGAGGWVTLRLFRLVQNHVFWLRIRALLL